MGSCVFDWRLFGDCWGGLGGQLGVVVGLSGGCLGVVVGICLV